MQANHLIRRLAGVRVKVVGAHNGPAIGDRPTCGTTHLRNTVFILFDVGVVWQRRLNIFRAGVTVSQLHHPVFITTILNACAAGGDVIQTCIVLQATAQTPTIGHAPVGITSPYQGTRFIVFLPVNVVITGTCFSEVVDLTNRNVKTFNRSVIIYASRDAGCHLVRGSNTVKSAIGTIAEQTAVVGLEERGVVVLDFALIAIRHIQVLHARFQRLGIAVRQVHITFENQLTVHFELWQHTVNGLFEIGVVAIVVPVQILLLIVGSHHLGFGIEASPVVRERQINGRLKVDTGRFRHIGIGIHEVYGLSINAGIKRTDVILRPVHVQLWLSAIGTGCLRAKDLELLGRNRGVEVLIRVTDAEFLRRVAIGT
ncbi:hypothetical protein D3C72_1258970 [compost metagenome]